MENIIVLTALYILFIALIYAPKCPKMTATDSAPIDYFPEIEEPVEITEEPDNLEPEVPEIEEPVEITEEPEVIQVTEHKTDTVEETAIAPAPSITSPDLATLTIRELKRMAKGKIKNYSNLTKSQLIQRLAIA